LQVLTYFSKHHQVLIKEIHSIFTTASRSDISPWWRLEK